MKLKDKITELKGVIYQQKDKAKGLLIDMVAVQQKDIKALRIINNKYVCKIETLEKELEKWKGNCEVFNDMLKNNAKTISELTELSDSQSTGLNNLRADKFELIKLSKTLVDCITDLKGDELTDKLTNETKELVEKHIKNLGGNK